MNTVTSGTDANPLMDTVGSADTAGIRRSFVLAVIGALIGLALAGYSLFTTRSASTLYVPAEFVALVNQQPISRIDFLAQLQALYGVDLAHSTSEQRQKVLGDLIREELFVQRAKELDVAATDAEVRSAMVNAVEQEIAADAMTSQPKEAQLRDYFAAHRDRYASEGIMDLRDYVFRNLADATGAAEALRASPSDAQQLVSRFHGSPNRKIAEDEFYFAAKIHLGDRLFDVARNLGDGAVSIPVASDDGIHVLHMQRNRGPAPFDFNTARDQVLTDFRTEAVRRLQQGDETFLRKRASILIAKDVE